MRETAERSVRLQDREFWFGGSFHSPTALSGRDDLGLAPVQTVLEAPKYVHLISVCERERTGVCVGYLIELHSAEPPEQNVWYMSMNY